MNIQGKVAVVTGSASGIGRATAVALAKAGAKGVVLADIDAKGIEASRDLVSAANADCKVITAVTDVTALASLEAMYETTLAEFVQVDVVFNNAGIVSGPPPFPDTDPARVKLVIDIDLTSVIVSTQLAVRHMRERGGVIINTASTGGLNPYLADAPYAAAKAGVIMFSRSCKDLHAACNIRVNAVCPGVTETPILEKLGGGSRPEWLTPIMENIKVLTPDDIAAAVLDLIRDDSMAGEYVVVANDSLGAGA
ncbi:MAG: SDR family NAD(P)-dependent oxidoreductase [Gammaproteobacteria bacterium]|nr:SDR family NAD(P)-dependent oxidoreductase [Gammaproteobacteria bacterium]